MNVDEALGLAKKMVPIMGDAGPYVALAIQLAEEIYKEHGLENGKKQLAALLQTEAQELAKAKWNIP